MQQHRFLSSHVLIPDITRLCTRARSCLIPRTPQRQCQPTLNTSPSPVDFRPSTPAVYARHRRLALNNTSQLQSSHPVAHHATRFLTPLLLCRSRSPYPYAIFTSFSFRPFILPALSSLRHLLKGVVQRRANASARTYTLTMYTKKLKLQPIL